MLSSYIIYNMYILYIHYAYDDYNKIYKNCGHTLMFSEKFWGTDFSSSADGLGVQLRQLQMDVSRKPSGKLI